MSEPRESSGHRRPRRRPRVLALAGTVLAVLLLLGGGAAWLPHGSFELLARGLERAGPRVEAAFRPEVPESLRAEVRAEVEAQARWLRSLTPSDLEPEAARTAALAAETLVRLLEDDELDPEEARFFAAQCRRFREEDASFGR